MSYLLAPFRKAQLKVVDGMLEVAADAIDGFLDLAYRTHFGGDRRVVRAGIEMIVSYLERYATRAGIAGVTASALSARWEPPGE